MRFSLQDGDTKKNLGGDGADAGFYNFQQSSAIKMEIQLRLKIGRIILRFSGETGR